MLNCFAICISSLILFSFSSAIFIKAFPLSFSAGTRESADGIGAGKRPVFLSKAHTHVVDKLLQIVTLFLTWENA
jgi:hypothetical protein